MANREPKSLFRRLTRLFRSGPIVKRKIRALDTGIAVADKTKSSGTLLFQKSLSPTYATITSNAYNLSERLMRYQDFQEMEYSVAYDTLVPLVGGGAVKIGELAEKLGDPTSKLADRDGRFMVYAYDHEKGVIVPAFAKQARQTCVDHAWKVTFDSGKSITASPEHRLMLRDGTYCKVEDLKVGDSMMPFYRKDLFEGAEEGTKGYSWVYTMDTRFRGWTKEHQLVAEWVAGRELAEDECVHHVNFVKADNRPENLRIMTKSDHSSYHAAINNGAKWAPENVEWVEQFKAQHAAWMRDNAPTRRRDVTFAKIVQVCERVGFSLARASVVLDVDKNLVYERLVANGFKDFAQFTAAYARGCERASVGEGLGRLTRDLSLSEVKSAVTESDTKRSLAIKLGCTVNVLDKFLNRRVNTTWSALREQMGWKNEAAQHRTGGRPKGSNSGSLTFKQVCDAYEPGLTLPRLSEKLGVNKNTVLSRLAQQGHKKYSDFAEQYQNHKVVSVEYVGVIPLYDLTVDGYKNFATDSVVSHNTPEIAAALDIYADETVAADDKGRCLHIYSDNEKIKELLEDLFYNTLNVEFNMRSWVRNLPVHKDTVIPLLDGRNITIEQLSQERPSNSSPHWVYSVQDKTNKLVPGKVVWCGLTREDSELVRVWLDDETYVDCTPDHEWVMRDGTQKRADQLAEGESLMPLYRSYVSNEDHIKGYERAYDPASDKFVYTHRAMPSYEWTRADRGKVVHHVNFNRHDNRPENLCVMTKEVHEELHKSVASSYNSSELHKQHDALRSAGMKKMWEDPARRAAAVANMQIKFDAECVDLIVAKLEAHGKYVSPRVLGNQLKADERFMGHFRAINGGTKRDLSKPFNSHTGFEALLHRAGVASYLSMVEQRLPAIAQTPWFKRAQEKSAKMSGKALTTFQGRSSVSAKKLNHRVARVERLSETSDVYCMEVLGPHGEHDRHNFAVASDKGGKALSGVFVGNCKYGDFFLYNDVSPEFGVVNAFPVPVNEVEREENYDRDDPFAVRYRWVTLGNRTLENWEVTHFRLLGNDMFLPYGSSIIEPARRIWRQLILIEDAMLVYRVVRAPERRVFYIDVANIPPENVPMYVEEQRRNLRTSQVTDRTTGRVDLRYNPLCLSMTTLIKLQDGHTLDLATLISEWDAGKRDQWVYSIDVEGRRIVPGKVTWAGVTRKDAELVRVHIDNGAYVDCTPDHKWMLRDGTYEKAEKLQPGQALMPLYTRFTTGEDGHKIVGYEETYDPFTDKYVLTHRNNAITVGGIDAVKGKVVHHADFDKLNNNPDNLVPLTSAEHHRVHAVFAAERNRSPAGRKCSSLRMKKTWSEGKINREMIRALRSDPAERAKRSASLTLKVDERLLQHCFCVLDKIGKGLSVREAEFLSAVNSYEPVKQYLRDLNPGYKNGYVDRFTHTNLQIFMRKIGLPKSLESLKRAWLLSRYDVSDIKAFCVNTPKCKRKDVLSKFGLNRGSFEELIKLNGEDVAAFRSQYLPGNSRYVRSISSSQRRVGYKNHCVVQVERLAQREDTGCLTVHGPVGEDDRHNFAVLGCTTDGASSTSGVFVMNSVDEDYFIPVRGSDTGTKIDTLAGGQNTAAVEDVAYIQKKLFAALKIPRAYLGYDEMLSSKATLAQEDIRFSRTINVIQKTIIAELNKLAIIHLYSHGYSSEDLQNFTLRLSNPSTVAQQQKLELWRAKFEIGGSLPEGMGSAEFVQHEIWGLSEEQIDAINEQRYKEKRINDAIEGGAGGEEAGGGGGEDLFGGGGGEEEAGGGGEGAGGGETPSEENAGEEPEEETESEAELLTSGDSEPDDESFALKVVRDTSDPVKVQNQLQRALYNRSRRRTHGASQTHMPDFRKMTSVDNHAMEDPYDNDWIKSTVNNPFSESRRSRVVPLPPDVVSTLKRMTQQLVPVRPVASGQLNEGTDVQDSIDESSEVQELDRGTLNESEVLIIDDEDGDGE